MKNENHQITKTEGKYFTFFGYTSDKNTYDIVVDKANGEISYLTNGLESDQCNIHGLLIKKMNISGITLTILYNGVVRQINNGSCTIKGAINRIKKNNKNVTLLNAQML